MEIKTNKEKQLEVEIILNKKNSMLALKWLETKVSTNQQRDVVQMLIGKERERMWYAKDDMRVCPLCGYPPAYSKAFISITCPHCGLTIKAETENEVKKKWNRRL